MCLVGFAAISYNDPMEDAESASSQNVSVARQRSRRPQGNRSLSFSLLSSSME